MILDCVIGAPNVRLLYPKAEDHKNIAATDEPGHTYQNRQLLVYEQEKCTLEMIRKVIHTVKTTNREK